VVGFHRRLGFRRWQDRVLRGDGADLRGVRRPGTALNYRGISKTAFVTRVLVALALAALATVVIGVWVSHPQHGDSIDPAGWLDVGGVHGVLQASGLIFFAFAGYARIATLGEEVKDPERTIPRAIPLALGITVVVYVAVALSALAAAGPGALAEATAPLTTSVHEVGADGLATVVRVGGAIACLGTLLALIAGIGRTTLAMARNQDLPGWLDAVHPTYRTPHQAEAAIAVVVSILVLTTDLRGVIGFSSFGILIYYGIANASAFTQPADQRRWPRALNVLGALACAVLVVSLPAEAVVAGAAMFAIGLLARLLLHPHVEMPQKPG
jgi:basic amino acid/polyamine antiporter, APA family